VVTVNPEAKTLLVYFSRAGENYYYGDRRVLDVGNTERLADMIRQRIECDSYRIEAADPYSDSYDETVDRDSAERDADAGPVIANPLPDVGPYATILLGSPVWNSRAPMIMSTFMRKH
ncbi:MAG: flavodoxin, partial [Stackebrandtia sp.]